MPRSFRFGNRTFGLIGIFLLAILSFVFFMSTPDPKLIMEEINGTLPKGTASPLGVGV